MILKSFNYFQGLLIIFLLFTPLNGEEKIDIWKNKNNNKISNTKKINFPSPKKNFDIDITDEIKKL